MQVANYKSLRFMVTMHFWEEMQVVKIEPTNRHNIHAVAIYRQRYRNCRLCSLQSSSKNVSIFFMRDMNKAYADITGAKVNRELAVVWKFYVSVYHLYGPNVYVDKMKELVGYFLADGHSNLCNSDFTQ